MRQAGRVSLRDISGEFSVRLFQPHAYPYPGVATSCRSKIGFWAATCIFFRSGGLEVLVDQTVQDRFPADPPGVEVCRGAMESVGVTVWDALGDALMRPGGVVVLLVLS